MSTLSTAAATCTDDDVDYSDIDNDEEISQVEEEVDDLSHSPNDGSEDRNDVSKEMESEGHKSHLELGSSTGEKSSPRRPFDDLAVGESRGNLKISGSSNEPFTRQKELSHENHEKSKCLKSRKQLTFAEENGSKKSEISKKDVGASPQVKTHEAQNELNTGGKVHFCNTEITDSESSSPSSVTRKNVTRGIWISRLGEGTPEEEIKQTDMHSGDDKQRMASRTRSLPPGAEIKDGNKRPAVICDFFAKGWCIKRNSCRFLHVKDDTSNSIQLEDDLAATTVKTEVQFDEGSRNETERSKRCCFPDALAPSVRNNVSFSSDLYSERILPQEPGESKCLDNSPSSRQLASFRDDMRSISSSMEVGRENLIKNQPIEDYGNNASLTIRDNLLPEHRSSSSGSAILCSNYHNGNPSSYPSSLEERPWIRSKYVHNDYPSPVLSLSLNSSLGTAGPTANSFSSRHITAWTGSSLAFFNSSLNAGTLDTQKLLDSDRECRNSRLSLFLRSAAAFSVSEPEKLGVSAGYKEKISSNDWEPSVPFRPSFFITSTSMTSTGSQYAPLRDIFDSPKIGNASLKVAFSSVAVSTLNMPEQLNGDSVLSKSMVPECDGDKSSVSSHGRFNESVLDKSCHTSRKDSLSDREEGVGTSIVDGQNGAVPKEDDPSVSTSIEDISKSKKINTNCDSRCQNDGCRHDKELKLDRVRQRNEMDLEHKIDGDVHKESKATKHLRNGLVDFIKELLKPTWREGRLSKDAHNTIVKKAADKIVGTLQPHQIPTTMESIKQYLSLSQPKIAKLVEGYVDKYGKS